MSEVIDRPLLDQEKSAKARFRIIDCDVHPSLHSKSDLNPFLAKRWHEHLKSYGDHLRTPYMGTTPYPQFVAVDFAPRRVARRPDGHARFSDLDFMRKQYLDPLDVEFGILQVLDMFIFSQQDLECGAAIQRAVNDWQLAHWSDRDSRLKASILVGQDPVSPIWRSPKSSAAPKVGRYVQINISPRANEADPDAAVTGRSMHARKSWGLPIGIHTGGYGGHPPSPCRRLAVLLCRRASVERAYHGGGADEPC